MSHPPPVPATHSEPADSADVAARFVSGSIMRHVIAMTLTGSIGLMALFVVDFADLFFISLLGETSITAAVGFAGTVAFANLSISIGMGIAAAALVAQNLGARKTDVARNFATSSLVCTVIASLVLSSVIYTFSDFLLRLLGAQGAALAHAKIYLHTLIPGFPLMAAAISCSFCLRAVGDARRAMYVTLVVAAVNAVLDPLFIFALGFGLQGAAMATVCANFCSFAISINGLQRVHGFLAPFSFAQVRRDLAPVFAIAGPAIMTQLATPFSIAYFTRITAGFGEEAVAAVAIINRLVPVAFGVIFSLSGAVGPIIGQNFGAQKFDRVRRSLTDSLLFSALYTLATALILFILRDWIPAWFLARGETATLVTFYCTWLAFTWAFAGAQFVSQAAFNNLGRPHWSTFFNWGKATIGTIPFILVGAELGGAVGVLIGSALGSVVFGIAATLTAYMLVVRIARQTEPARKLPGEPYGNVDS